MGKLPVPCLLSSIGGCATGLALRGWWGRERGRRERWLKERGRREGGQAGRRREEQDWRTLPVSGWTVRQPTITHLMCLELEVGNKEMVTIWIHLLMSIAYYSI